MRIKKKWIVIPVFFLILFVVSCSALQSYGESKFLSAGPNGPDTPEKYGIPYERIKIPSGNGLLDGYLVKAENEKGDAVLVFHGAGETISDWAKAQSILYHNGISSIVFDYSGHGGSTRKGSIKNLNEDACSAYSYFVSKFPGCRFYVLGFSLGNAPLLASIKSFNPAPAGIVVASPFSSLRELGRYSGKSNFLRRLIAEIIPDSWNNVDAIKENHVPLIVLHSDTDQSNPLFMGKNVFKAANEPKKFVLLHGLQHNAPINDSSKVWWDKVIEFIKNGVK